MPADKSTMPEACDRSKAAAQQWELRLSPRGLEIVAGDVQLAETYWWATAGAKTVEGILAGEGFKHDPNSFGGGIQGAAKANADQLANWRKMAAAPDLLEALTAIITESVVEGWDEDRDDIDGNTLISVTVRLGDAWKARSAIQRAEGQGT